MFGKLIAAGWGGALAIHGEGLAQVGPSPFACPWGGMMTGPWGFFSGLFTIVFGALVLAGLFYAVRRLAATGGGSAKQPGTATESPVDILKKRYARGEIDLEEYEAMKRELLE